MPSCLRGNLSGYSRKALPVFAKLLKSLVSAAGFEPATHALKGLLEAVYYSVLVCAFLCLHVFAKPNNFRHRPKQALTGHVSGHVAECLFFNIL